MPRSRVGRKSACRSCMRHAAMTRRCCAKWNRCWSRKARRPAFSPNHRPGFTEELSSDATRPLPPDAFPQRLGSLPPREATRQRCDGNRPPCQDGGIPFLCPHGLLGRGQGPSSCAVRHRRSVQAILEGSRAWQGSRSSRRQAHIRCRCGVDWPSRHITSSFSRYIEGRTLQELMRQFKVIPEALLRELGAQIADALQAVHEAGAIHRDIKPANVLVTPFHRVKVMDLGIARLLDESTGLTQPEHFVGTALYAAPEQFGGKDVGPAADLYALGVVLYECATGTQPFAAQGLQAVMRRQLDVVPPRAGSSNPQTQSFLRGGPGLPSREGPGATISVGSAISRRSSSWVKARPGGASAS